MTAYPNELAPGPILPAALRRLPTGPAEGWLTLALVTLMALTVAWSLDDAAWVLNRGELGDFYAPAAIIASLLGFVGAKVGWPRWVSHFVGAVAAALILPIFVGMAIAPDAASLGEMYRATATAVTRAWIDLAVLNRSVTVQTGHYLMAIGIIVWSVGQFAAYAVFGHRRPLDAVIVVGLILLGNMSMTANEQLPYLVIFSIAALFVLARAHAFDEQSVWIRRRIGDATAVRSLYLRGGTAFIILAVVGSLVLTASASSAPLAGQWTAVGERMVEISQWLQRLLPFGGNPRAVGFGFGPQAVITGVWQTDSSHAVTIQVAPTEDEEFYWRAVVFDEFDVNGWTWSQSFDVHRRADEPTLADLADDPALIAARRELRFTVQPVGLRGSWALSPLDPTSVSRDSDVVVVGEGGYFGGLKLRGGTADYTVVASVPILGEDLPGGLSQNRLRAAGLDYPAEIVSLYTQVPDGAIGPEARLLLERIVQLAPDDNPFDVANTMVQVLRSRAYTYSPDVRGVAGCQELGAVECFARYRQGYCLYYASTMAILLRDLGIPTRLAEGFLPGTRDRGGREVILSSAAHAWVEVYFPAYGWVMFDPTGGGLAQAAPLPTGAPLPSAGASNPGLTRPPEDDVVPSRRLETDFGTTTPNSGGGNDAAFMIAVALVLLVAIGGLAFIAWQRGPRGDLTPDGVWRSVGRTAARFGFGPRPTQTVYEYAGSLGDVLPDSRPQLQTVARAKVEVAYGRRLLGDDALRSLRDAQRRLRLGLLRLALRRKERRARRRGG
ncbi:MAG TPA: transglutaminaseTgpA domain-containing protein [Candidatus Limnocylindrales bacterium]|jgi:transglutaminase-like putative cysteine protease|nr:transglutaminaseTgpA domain-containing protein [Candidatus Limnocylindrales bacterium]